MLKCRQNTFEIVRGAQVMARSAVDILPFLVTRRDAGVHIIGVHDGELKIGGLCHAGNGGEPEEGNL
jgi:hypothetical protein